MGANLSSMPAIILLETIFTLTSPGLPWGNNIMDALIRKNVFSMLRDLILCGTVNIFLAQKAPLFIPSFAVYHNLL